MSGELVHELEVGLMPIALHGDTESDHLYVVCHGDHMIYQVLPLLSPSAFAASICPFDTDSMPPRTISAIYEAV